MLSGTMLTLARDSAGLTQTALAHAVGISQSRLSSIEGGILEPSVEVAESIARECNVPVELLYARDVVHGQSVVDIFHRKRATLPAKALRRATANVNLIRMEVSRLMRSVDLTDSKPLPVLGPDHEMSPVEAAEYVRASWRIPPGPLPDLVNLIESTGTPVVVVNMGHRKLAAMSMPAQHQGFLIALNEMMPASNRRWSLAHELGHLVLHGGAVTPDLEREADQFASALLMPDDDIRPLLRNIQFSGLGQIKPVWRVSLAALIHKAHDLGEITDRQRQTFYMRLNQLPGGRMREPGEFAAEQPKLVRHVIDYFVNDCGFSVDDLARMLMTLPETARRRYLGEAVAGLRPVGRGPGLHSVPALPR